MLRASVFCPCAEAGFFGKFSGGPPTTACLSTAYEWRVVDLLDPRPITAQMLQSPMEDSSLNTITKQLISAALVALLPNAASLAAVRGDDTAYVGGTISAIPQGTKGQLNLQDKARLAFEYGKAGKFSLPYKNVTSLEFGQKVGRRVGSTIALGVTTLGIGALPMLFSKKKKHFLSVAFTEEDGSNGAMVLELSKGNVRTVLATIEARTGKKVEHEEGTAKQGKDKN